MKYQGIDKFEYKYVKLGISPQKSVELLNVEGAKGWELIKLIDVSPIAGDVYRAILKRKITEVEV